MASVTFNDVAKVYPDGTRAVSDLNLEISDGEFLVLVGPSGCGKTTALRMVAGLEDISEGEILVDAACVNAVAPQKRDIAMIFQNYALYPHMNVFDNIAFPLRSRRASKSEIRERVEATAVLLGLTDMLRRRPKTLSGGQRQRVAMGRAIVRRPQVFLMDEPLSNLDAKLRAQMRAEIAAIQRELRTTTIYVTHDQVEAMTMGTRIAVMRKGRIQQHGAPQELFSTPANLFVASFLGSPSMNLFEARIAGNAQSISLVLSGGETLHLPSSILSRHTLLAARRGGSVAIGIRPDHLSMRTNNSDAGTLHGRVSLLEILGADQLVHLEIQADPVVTEEILEVASDTDATAVDILERGAGSRRVTIVARLSADVAVHVGDELGVSVDPERLHFFDLDTGASMRDG